MDEKNTSDAPAHSPVVGEKRLRDEDDSEQQRDGQNGNVLKSESSPTPAPSGQNGGAYSGGQMNGAAGAGGSPAGSGQHDALYIGDLQWVCTLLCSFLAMYAVSLRRSDVCALRSFFTVDD